MKRKSLLTFLFCAALLLPGTGCEKAPEPAPAAAPKKAAPIKPKDAPVDTGVSEEVVAKYAYDPSGRRDPFEPLFLGQRPVVDRNEPLTPLQTFDLGQLRLVAIIVGKGAPTAMVMAPDGKGYILKRGIRVGRNNGRVVGITAESVQVEEEYYDFSGEVRRNIQEIPLPKREGV